MISEDENDCTSCRLVSGFGCIGIGLYVGIVGSKNAGNSFSRGLIILFGAGFAGIGTARLFNLPPFRQNNKKANPD